MSKPVAGFGFSVNGRTFTFYDASGNTPTSWAWDFGNGTTSVAQNPPAVTYATEGTFNVKLTATNADGSDIASYQVLASNDPTIGASIYQMVIMDLPTGTSIPTFTILQHIRKWQLFLYAQVGISTTDIFTEVKWPTLVNMLISKLVIYEFITQEMTRSMTSTSGSTTSTSKGPIKSIKTGPSEVEWHDASSYWATMLKTDGAMDGFKAELCMLARRIGIRLSGICPPLVSTHMFIVGKKPRKNCPG